VAGFVLCEGCDGAGPSAVAWLDYKCHPQIDPVTAGISDTVWEPEVLEQAIPRFLKAKYGGGGVRWPDIPLANYLANPRLEVLDQLADGHGIKFAVVCP
jgi:hypothetical protein